MDLFNGQHPTMGGANKKSIISLFFANTLKAFNINKVAEVDLNFSFLFIFLVGFAVGGGQLVVGPGGTLISVSEESVLTPVSKAFTSW